MTAKSAKTAKRKGPQIKGQKWLDAIWDCTRRLVREGGRKEEDPNEERLLDAVLEVVNATNPGYDATEWLLMLHEREEWQLGMEGGWKYEDE